MINKICNYKCNYCKTKSVKLSIEFLMSGRSGRDYDYYIYKCLKCEREISIHEDDYYEKEDGEIIYFDIDD